MLHTLLAAVAIGGVIAVLYSYALYPVVLFVIGSINQGLRDVGFVFRKGDRRIDAGHAETDPDWPPVAVVISAYNEETHIVARIENLLALDYPADRLRAYIGSDGSRDRTAALMAQFQDEPRVVALPFEVNRGKASVLNDLVSRTVEPIVVFSDANTYFERSALKRLVTRFQDPKVGGVTGELRLMGNDGDNQDSLYWRIEQFLKFFEARIGALLGANGAIYAIRRELWQPLRPDTICDDFCVAMNVSAAGHRLVYEPKAWAEEDTPEQIGEEVKRRIRIGIGNFQALARHPQYLTRTSLATAFAYVSHKVLRWTAPHLLLLALAASVALAALQGSAGWALYAAAQALAYSAAWAGWRLTSRGVKLPTLVKLAAFLFALNWAFLVASWRFATGRYAGSWGRTQR
ncbi:glycosyltransferase family 2 protein [Sphaerotilus sp.]|uniref:glycosyltransferase family 2 protein n=1 Tax=Sphaerotilus sp. TaxID=2093942 RepID=UPI002ACE2C49|nr:glycosyltransferase family 2 protein [Sphaerotilus sp.]MDZ7858222.1 glycosyltransferase family 2 protein [Sphaerotilus sp.]